MLRVGGVFTIYMAVDRIRQCLGNNPGDRTLGAPPPTPPCAKTTVLDIGTMCLETFFAQPPRIVHQK